MRPADERQPRCGSSSRAHRACTRRVDRRVHVVADGDVTTNRQRVATPSDRSRWRPRRPSRCDAAAMTTLAPASAHDSAMPRPTPPAAAGDDDRAPSSKPVIIKPHPHGAVRDERRGPDEMRARIPEHRNHTAPESSVASPARPKRGGQRDWLEARASSCSAPTHRPGAVAIVLAVTPCLTHWRPTPFANTLMPSATDASTHSWAAPERPTPARGTDRPPPASRSGAITRRVSHHTTLEAGLAGAHPLRFRRCP